MHPLLSEFIWQIDGTYIPQMRARLEHASTGPFQTKLPAHYEAKIAANGITKIWNNYLTEKYSTDRSVLVLPLSGEMSRYGYWDNFGNEFYIRALKSAASDADFKGAVLQMNTPGGTADSTPAFAQAVVEFRKVKPIVVQTGYLASAGVYVGSQANEIIIEPQAASSIGSIGTLLILENYSKWLEQQGIQMEIMRADKSKDKALVNWIEPTPEEAKEALRPMLNACQKEFEGAVKRGRAGKIKSDEIFSGLMYGADQAISLGLADRKGDLALAVKRVLELAA